MTINHQQLFHDFMKNAIEMIHSQKNSTAIKEMLGYVHFVDYNGNELTLSVKSDFDKKFLNNNLYHKLESVAKLYWQDLISINLVVAESSVLNLGLTDSQTIEAPPLPSNEPFYTTNQDFLFENYAIGESNKEAYSIFQNIQQKINDLPFSLLFCYGAMGLGKTHLMQALVNSLKQMPQQSACYIPMDEFVKSFTNSVQANSTNQFMDRFSQYKAIMIDDFQFIKGKKGTMAQMTKIINNALLNKQLVIINSNIPLKEFEDLDITLKSRIAGGVFVTIHNADFNLRLAILAIKLKQFQQKYPELVVDSDILTYIAQHVTSNNRELEGCLSSLVTRSVFSGQPATLKAAIRIIEDHYPSQSKVLNIKYIQDCVAAFYNISHQDLISNSRKKEFTLPRQIAMHLCKNLTQESLKSIGESFGKRDHTTVMHAIEKIDSLFTTHNQFQYEYDKITQKIQSL